jgi:hypothetical protein
MKDLPPSRIFNSADPRNQHRLMRETLSALGPNPHLGFLMIHLVAAFIDGLASGPVRQNKKAYLECLRRHFPDLCLAIGAELPYSHMLVAFLASRH